VETENLTMPANARIERKKQDIAKARDGMAKALAKAAGYKEKLRKLNGELEALENAEIIALFRSDEFNEDGLAALIRSRRGQTARAGSQGGQGDEPPREPSPEGGE